MSDNERLVVIVEVDTDHVEHMWSDVERGWQERYIVQKEAELRKYRRGNVVRPYGDPHGPLVTILRVEKSAARQVLIRAVVIGHSNPRKGWRVYRNGETVSWWCEGVPA